MTRNHVISEYYGWHVHVILELHGEQENHNASTMGVTGIVVPEIYLRKLDGMYKSRKTIFLELPPKTV